MPTAASAYVDQVFELQAAGQIDGALSAVIAEQEARQSIARGDAALLTPNRI